MGPNEHSRASRGSAEHLATDVHETIKTLVGGITVMHEPVAALHALRESGHHLRAIARASRGTSRRWRALGREPEAQIAHHLREQAQLLERCVALAARCAEAEADDAALVAEHDISASYDVGRFVRTAHALKAAGGV